MQETFKFNNNIEEKLSPFYSKFCKKSKLYYHSSLDEVINWCKKESKDSNLNEEDWIDFKNKMVDCEFIRTKEFEAGRVSYNDYSHIEDRYKNQIKE